jgi:hypothetical protein
MAEGVVNKIMALLDKFSPKTFNDDEGAQNYVHGISRGRGRTYKPGIDSFLRNFGNVNKKLEAGDTSDPSVKLVDSEMRPIPDDLILTRTMTPESFGLNAQNIAQIEELTGKLVNSKGYTSTNIGTPYDRQPGRITMTIATPAGTKALIPNSSQPSKEVVLSRDQPLRITKVEPDGAGGYNILAVVSGDSDGEKPVDISKAVPTKDVQEAEIPEGGGQVGTGVGAGGAAGGTGTGGGTGPEVRNDGHVGIVGGNAEGGTEVAGGDGTEVPEVPQIPEKGPDGRNTFRDAFEKSDLQVPSVGTRRKQFMDAYNGVASGKKTPQEAVSELDNHITANKKILESDKADGTDSGPLPEDIKRQEALRDLIAEHFNFTGRKQFKEKESGGEVKKPAAKKAPSKAVAKKAAAPEKAPETGSSEVTYTYRYLKPLEPGFRSGGYNIVREGSDGSQTHVKAFHQKDKFKADKMLKGLQAEEKQRQLDLKKKKPELKAPEKKSVEEVDAEISRQERARKTAIRKEMRGRTGTAEKAPEKKEPEKVPIHEPEGDAKATRDQWLKDAGVNYDDLSDFEKVGVNLAADQVASGKATPASIKRRFAGDSNANLKKIGDAVPARRPRKQVSKPEKPEEKTPEGLNLDEADFKKTTIAQLRQAAKDNDIQVPGNLRLKKDIFDHIVKEMARKELEKRRGGSEKKSDLPNPENLTGRDLEVDQAIRQGFLKHRKPSGFASIGRIRQDLDEAGFSRKEQNDAFGRIGRGRKDPYARVIPVADMKSLDDVDRKGSFRMGGEDNHAIRFLDMEEKKAPEVKKPALRKRSQKTLSPERREEIATELEGLRERLKEIPLGSQRELGLASVSEVVDGWVGKVRSGELDQDDIEGMLNRLAGVRYGTSNNPDTKKIANELSDTLRRLRGEEIKAPEIKKPEAGRPEWGTLKSLGLKDGDMVMYHGRDRRTPNAEGRLARVEKTPDGSPRLVDPETGKTVIAFGSAGRNWLAKVKAPEKAPEVKKPTEKGLIHMTLPEIRERAKQKDLKIPSDLKTKNAIIDWLADAEVAQERGEKLPESEGQRTRRKALEEKQRIAQQIKEENATQKVARMQLANERKQKLEQARKDRAEARQKAAEEKQKAKDAAAAQRKQEAEAKKAAAEAQKADENLKKAQAAEEARKKKAVSEEEMKLRRERDKHRYDSLTGSRWTMAELRKYAQANDFHVSGTSTSKEDVRKEIIRERIRKNATDLANEIGLSGVLQMARREGIEIPQFHKTSTYGAATWVESSKQIVHELGIDPKKYKPKAPPVGHVTNTINQPSRTVYDALTGGVDTDPNHPIHVTNFEISSFDTNGKAVIKNGLIHRRNGVTYLTDIGDGDPNSPYRAAMVTYAFEEFHKTLPAGSTEIQSAYAWIRDPNPSDAYWQKQFNSPDHESFASAGNGTVAIWNRWKDDSQQSTVRGREDSLRHEYGHNVDNLRAYSMGLNSEGVQWGDATRRPVAPKYQPGSFTWNKYTDITMEPDPKRGYPNGVTTYGKSSVKEDFAEAMELYWRGILGTGRRKKDGKLEVVYFRDLFPERAAILDKLFPAFARKQKAEHANKGIVLER